MRKGVAFIGITLLACATACSFLVDANAPQCTTDSECTSRGGSFISTVCRDSKCVAGGPVDSGVALGDGGIEDAPSGPWRCVGNVKWPKLDMSRTITLIQNFADFVDEKPLANIGLKACLRADVGCLNPFSTAVSDADGSAPLALPYAFDGYWLLLPPEGSSLVTYVVHELPPPELDMQVAVTTQPILRSSLELLAGIVGVTLNPERGHLSASVVDCDLKRVSGIVLEADPMPADARVFYLENKLPNPQRTSTDENAQAGFANLAPGLVTITAKIAESGKIVARYPALVQADRFTTFVLPPTPL